jgi:hypothetical protein
VRAREWKGDLVLLHEVTGGPAESSYGLAVARLAGVPGPVVARAKAVLSRLEKGARKPAGWPPGWTICPVRPAGRGRGGTAGDRCAKGWARSILMRFPRVRRWRCSMR